MNILLSIFGMYKVDLGLSSQERLDGVLGIVIFVDLKKKMCCDIMFFWYHSFMKTYVLYN